MLVFFLSNYMIFQPPRNKYIYDDTLLKIKTSDGTHITAIFLQNTNAQYTIIYSHGNAEDLSTVIINAEALYKLGFSVLAYDYRGYGASEGKPTENGTYRDIEAAYHFLLSKKIPAENIILLGQSLGTGPSVELAVKHHVAGLVLVSPYTTIYRVVTKIPLFFPEKYRNIAKINKISAPILVIHGKNDEVVPFAHGHKIYSTYNGLKDYAWVNNAGHNNLDYIPYINKIKELIGK